MSLNFNDWGSPFHGLLFFFKSVIVIEHMQHLFIVYENLCVYIANFVCIHVLGVTLDIHKSCFYNPISDTNNEIPAFASAKGGCSLAHGFYSRTTNDSREMYPSYCSDYKDHCGEHSHINTNMYKCVCIELIKSYQVGIPNFQWEQFKGLFKKENEKEKAINYLFLMILKNDSG